VRVQVAREKCAQICGDVCQEALLRRAWRSIFRVRDRRKSATSVYRRHGSLRQSESLIECTCSTGTNNSITHLLEDINPYAFVHHSIPILPDDAYAVPSIPSQSKPLFPLVYTIVPPFVPTFALNGFSRVVRDLRKCSTFRGQ
jgi:hypothetical protein